MQSFIDQERNRLMEKSRVIAPYARRVSPSPYMFAGRNFNSPRGRIHDPNEGSGNAKNGRSGNALTGPGNALNSPFVFVDGTGGNEINKNSWENNISTEWNPSKVAKLAHLTSNADRENHFKKRTNIFQSRFPVQLIGKLSLTEANASGSWTPCDDAEVYPKAHAKGMEGKASGHPAGVKNKSPHEDFHIKRKEHRSRLLTGSVDQVLHWFELKNNVNLLFEVMAPLINIKSGKFPGEKCLVLRDEKTGPSLLVTFYEIDRMLAPLVVGSVVKCIGRLTSRNSLHAFKVEQSSEEEKAHSHRLFFISNLVAQEAKLIFSKK